MRTPARAVETRYVAAVAWICAAIIFAYALAACAASSDLAEAADTIDDPNPQTITLPTK
jgi:hypothetical protein